MASNVEQTVTRVIAELLEKKEAEIPLHASLRDDLGMDSLKQMTLFILLEDEFHRTMQPEEVTGVASVQDVIDFINGKLEETSTEPSGVGSPQLPA